MPLLCHAEALNIVPDGLQRFDYECLPVQPRPGLVVVNRRQGIYMPPIGRNNQVGPPGRSQDGGEVLSPYFTGLSPSSDDVFRLGGTKRRQVTDVEPAIPKFGDVFIGLDRESEPCRPHPRQVAHSYGTIPNVVNSIAAIIFSNDGALGGNVCCRWTRENEQ